MSFSTVLSGLWRDRKGSSFIELALLTPVVLLLFCGATDFARVVHAGISVAGAARAGVQYGALTPGHSGDTDGMRTAATADAADLSNVTATARNFCSCDGGVTEVDCSVSCSGATPSGYVSVTANYTFNSLIPWPGMPQQVAIARTAKMRVQ